MKAVWIFFLFLSIGLTPAHSFAGESVSVTIKSDPSGVSIIMDRGMLCLETPCTVMIPKGPHRFLVQADHYKPIFRDVTFTSSRTLFFRLPRRFAELNITSSPTGLDIVMNGLRTGFKTPALAMRVAPRSHHVTLSGPCEKAVTKTIRVGIGQTKSLHIKMKSKQTTLTVDAKDVEGKPVLAVVLIDNQPVGETPGTFSVSLCAKSLSLKKETYKPFHQSINLKNINKQSIHAVLHTSQVTVGPTVFPVDVGLSPARGNESTALVTIIEFSDYQCPHCKRAEKVLQTLLKHHGSDIRVYYRQFPLPFHKHAISAAKAALAARAQGKFWEYHQHLYENNHALTYADLVRYAEQVGLDMKEFTFDMYNVEMEDEIFADMAAAKKLDIKGTPAFFINGQLIVGSHPFPVMNELVKKEIKRVKPMGLTGDALYKKLTGKKTSE